MELVLDGVIYHEHAEGGISRRYDEILPRICDLDEVIRVTLVTEGRLRRPLPEHPRIRQLAVPPVGRYLHPGRVWNGLVPRARRLVRRLTIGSGRGNIWESTHYTLPDRWEGARVVLVHDLIRERFPDFYAEPHFDHFRELKRRGVLAADAVMCNSETTRQDVLRWYEIEPAKAFVVPNACSDLFRPLDGDDAPIVETEKPFLLYIGGCGGFKPGHYKFFDGLLDAYLRWPHNKEVDLVVVGSNWREADECHLAELAGDRRVHFSRNVDDLTICHLYNQAAAFVYPSLYEGFGIPLLEAMACGCPVVASRIPSTVEVAGDCLFYFEPGDKEGLQAALDASLAQGRDAAWVRAGFEQVKRYSWDRTAQETLDVYRKVGQMLDHRSPLRRTDFGV